MECIARKKQRLLPYFIAVITLGVLFTGFGVVLCALGLYTLLPGVVSILIGVAIGGLGIWRCVCWKKLPDEIVSVSDTEMQLPEGRYAMKEVLDVSYRLYYSIIGVRWGSLVIELDGKTFVYPFVADVAETQQRLLSRRLSGCNAPIDR